MFTCLLPTVVKYSNIGQFCLCVCRSDYVPQQTIRITHNLQFCVLVHYADIDECSDGNYTCQENAVCSNLMGGYKCVCKDGYERTDNNSCIGM